MLGCVTPWIICPGTARQAWKESEIKYHATMLAACLKRNCGSLCYSPKVVVLPPAEVWPQRESFLRALHRQLGEVPQVSPYHPDAHPHYSRCKAENVHHCQDVLSIYAQKVGESLWEPFFRGQNFKKLPTLLIDAGSLDELCRQESGVLRGD